MYCMYLYICTTVFVCTLINNRVLLHKTMIKIIFYSGHVGKRPPPPINYQHIIDGRNSQNNKYQTPRHLIDTTSATFLVLYIHTPIQSSYSRSVCLGFVPLPLALRICLLLNTRPAMKWVRLFITDFWPGNFVKNYETYFMADRVKNAASHPTTLCYVGVNLLESIVMYTQIVSAESPLFFFFFLTCPLC